MRRVFALALLALVLSGCSAGTSDDGTPPNADPNGQQTLPPAGSSSASTGPPTGTNSTSASATGAPGAPGPTSFRAHDAEDSATDPDFPSLFVGGRLQGSGPQLRIEATANNMGERDYKVKSGCEDPWSETLRDADGAVAQHRQPIANCAGYTMTTFAAHDFLSTALTWNGTLWDVASGSFVAAPAGSYTWEVTFDVYSGGSGTQYDDHAALTVSFDVEVP